MYHVLVLYESVQLSEQKKLSTSKLRQMEAKRSMHLDVTRSICRPPFLLLATHIFSLTSHLPWRRIRVAHGLDRHKPPVGTNFRWSPRSFEPLTVEFPSLGHARVVQLASRNSGGSMILLFLPTNHAIGLIQVDL
jgi:hypothetical protein